MAWVKFNQDFDWSSAPPPDVGVTIAYLAGMRCSVTHSCKTQAIDLGRAEHIKAPNAADAAQLKANPYWTGDLDAAAGADSP